MDLELLKFFTKIKKGVYALWHYNGYFRGTYNIWCYVQLSSLKDVVDYSQQYNSTQFYLYGSVNNRYCHSLTESVTEIQVFIQIPAERAEGNSGEGKTLPDGMRKKP